MKYNILNINSNWDGYMTRIKLTMNLRTLIVLACVATLAACAGNKPKVNMDGPFWKENDRKPISEPKLREPNLLWTSVDRTLFDQSLELLDVDRSVRKISGHMTKAVNTNVYDEVPNSSWFTNRMGLPQTRLTPREVEIGPHGIGGPDPNEIWHVFRPKVGGVTPGFWIEDGRGNQYIIKFDPKGYPDLSTGATTMAGHFFYACGFNVAQEYIVNWHPRNLRVREGATIKGAKGKEEPLTMDHIHDILDQIEKQPDGSIRSLASLLLGNIKGPYSYKGTRKGDPNDVYRHEHRRELRGLYVLASFVNHFDIKDDNSMDVYVGNDGEGHLEHYLMDFGSTFGAAAGGPTDPINGYANLMDVRDMGVSMLTLGLKKWQWEDAGPVVYPSAGYYESEIFEPNKWDPIYPIPPFENITDQDGYWGAKIMLAFRDEHLRALLKVGQYSDKDAEEYLFKTMKERRDKIGRYWFSKITPLDYPTVSSRSDRLEIAFHDLAVEYGLDTNRAVYRYEIHQNGQPIIDPGYTAYTRISLTDDDLASVLAAGSGSGKDQILYEVKIKTEREIGYWSQPAVFWLAYQPNARKFSIVGIEHPGQ
jgi:hypothetical protein